MRHSPEPSEACVGCGVTICSSSAPASPDGTGSLCGRCGAPPAVDHAAALAKALRGVVAAMMCSDGAYWYSAMDVAESALAAYDAAKGRVK